MMTVFNDLQSIGLSQNQALVYLALFRVGEAKAGEIIKKTGLHRNLVYVALQELIDKKLVASFNKLGGVAIYKVLGTTRLLVDLQEKERIAKNVIEELSLLSKKGNNQEIVVYEGIDEFRRHVMHTYGTIKPKGLIRYLGISPRWYDIVGPVLSKDLGVIHSEKKFKMRGLAKSISRGDREYIQKMKGLAEVRINPLISSDTNGIEILDERISIRSFIEPYFVVEITHRHLAKNYQNYFDFLWGQSKVWKG